MGFFFAVHHYLYRRHFLIVILNENEHCYSQNSLHSLRAFPFICSFKKKKFNVVQFGINKKESKKEPISA